MTTELVDEPAYCEVCGLALVPITLPAPVKFGVVDGAIISEDTTTEVKCPSGHRRYLYMESPVTATMVWTELVTRV
jgi:hypothetical protein